MNRVTAYVGLGSNLGDRGGLIEAGLSALAAHGRVEVTSRSALVETPPVGPPQPTYLNGAAAVRTDLDPADLLAALARIEAALGRNRRAEQRWGPRLLDMDLLLYGDVVIDLPDLTIPHPRMHLRAFVLGPLAQIAPDAVHPVLEQTIQALYDRLPLRAGLAPRNRRDARGVP